MPVLTNQNNQVLSAAAQEVLSNFIRFLVAQNLSQNDAYQLAADTKEFLLFVGNGQVNAYELEKYIHYLVNNNIPTHNIKTVALALHRFYGFLNIVLPKDSILLEYASSNQVLQRDLVEKGAIAANSNFLGSSKTALTAKIAAYTITLLGWIGLLGKIRILYLIILGLAGLASSSYIVQHPGIVTDARDSIRRYSSETLNQAAKPVVINNQNTEVKANTAPSLDPRFGELNSQLNSLSFNISAMQTSLTAVNSDITEIVKIINNNTSSNYASTSSLVYVNDTAGMTNLRIRAEQLEEYINSGFDVSKFKIVDGNNTVLSYNTSDTTSMEANSDATVLGNLIINGDLGSNGILQLMASNNDPDDNPDGGLYFNKDNNQLYVANGDSWSQVGKTYSIISGKGVELVNDRLGLINCSSNELLQYSSGTWACSADIATTSPASFLGLVDVPSTYSSMGNRLLRVGAGESSLEFVSTSTWDQNSANDLTSASSFGGDVSGIYSNLQLGTSVVNSNELASSGVTAGTYGASTSLPVFTIDQDGRITLATNIAFSGGANISSLGTISSGTWHGSILEVAYGGTGKTSFGVKSLLLGNGTGPMQETVFGGSIKVLTANSSSQPEWVDSSVLGWGISGNASKVTDILGTTNTAPLRIGVSSQEKLRITSSGRIGIGTTSPSEKFHISGGSLLIDRPNISNMLGSNGISSFPFGGPYRFSIDGLYAYVAFGSQGVFIYDLSNDSMSAVGNITASNSVTDAYISGDYLYLATGGSVMVYNVSSPSAPVLAGVKSIGASLISTIKVVGKYAYFGGNAFGMLDISDLSNITVLGTQPISVTNIEIKGNAAYVSRGSSGVSIIDISNPYNLSVMGTLDPGTSNDIKVVGNYTYVADLTGLKIIDISNSTSPVLMSSTTGQYQGIDVSGDYAYMAGYSAFDIYKITNATSPELINSYVLSIIGFYNYYDIKVSGNRVYSTVNPAGASLGLNGIIVQKIGGFETSNLNAGNINAGNFSLADNLEIGHNFKVDTGLNVGTNGILSNGVVSIVNSGVTTNFDATSLSVISGSNNGARINIQTNSTGNYSLEVETTGISRLFVSGNGNVGIGTSNPSAFGLEVAGSLGPSTNPILIAKSQNSVTFSPASDVGYNLSSALNLNGFPVFVTSMKLGSLSAFRVTSCYDQNCSDGVGNQILLTSNSANTNGTSIAFPSDGNPIVTSYNDDNNGLNVVKCSNPTCSSYSTTSFEINAGKNSSVTIGADDLPIISHYNSTSTTLRVTKCSNSTCTLSSTTQIDSGSNLGIRSSVKIGADRLPIIAYEDQGNGDLKVAKCLTSDCSRVTITTVDSSGTVGQDPSLAIPPDGLPVISSYQSTGGNLRLTKCSNALCTVSTSNSVDTSNDVGTASSIAIGTDGLPVISYYDATGNDLKIAKCLNTTCSSVKVTVLDTTNNSGVDTSILSGSDGLPFIVYQQTVSDGELISIKCADEACSQTSFSGYSGGYDLGSMSVYWNNIYATNYYAKDGLQVSNFDIAEDYEALDASIEAGDVVSVSSDNEGFIELSNQNNKKAVIGVISTKPGFKLTNFNAVDRSNQRPIALAGRVPVKISKSSEKIEPGDYLSVSSDSGKAAKAFKDDYIIGKALESWDPQNPKETIMLFVKLGFYSSGEQSNFSEISNLKQTGVSKVDLNMLIKESLNNSIKLNMPVYIRGLSVLNNIYVSGDIKIHGDIFSEGDKISLQEGSVIITKDGDLITQNDVHSKGKITFSELEILRKTNDSAVGTASIPEGETKTYVETKTVEKGSRVFINSKNPEVLLYVSGQDNSKGFEVSRSNKLDSKVEFDWFIMDENIL